MKALTFRVAIWVWALTWISSSVQAADVYWDINGTTGGAGGGNAPSGTWNAVNAFWNTHTNGAAGTLTTSPGPGNRAVFAANTGATGSYTVTVSGTRTLNDMLIQEGTVITLAGVSGGTLVDPDTFVLTTFTNRTVTFDSTLSLSATGIIKSHGGTLNFQTNFTGSGADIFLVNGTVNHSAGTLKWSNIGADMQLAGTLPGSGTSATYNISGGVLESAGAGKIIVGQDGPAELILSANGFVDNAVGGGVVIGESGDPINSVVNLNGGTLRVGANGITQGAGTQGIFNFNGGTLQGSAQLSAGGGQFFGNGLATVIQAGGAIIDTAGMANPTAIQTVLAHDAALGATLDGGLTKIGAGTLILSAANTYTGDTTVSAGALLVNGSLASGVTLSGAGTLGGSGSISGLVTTSGLGSNLSPGNSPGTLSLLGGLDATAGATFNFELGATSDLVDLGASALTGSAAAGGLLFNLFDAGGLSAFTPYTLISFGTSSDLNYSDLALGNLPSGYSLDSGFGNGGWLITGGNLQVQLEAQSAAVPEPSTWIMLALGSLGLFFFVRRNRLRQGSFNG